ncbi:hypothetical protein M8R20_03180 [Pseudomonas sp. R2.Fl]|nr:hypothetical protein [Pseudomonas sp. R2.Fl]
MSIDSDLPREQQEMAVARVLAENRGDELTDMLVESLYETLRLLEEELAAETLH